MENHKMITILLAEDDAGHASLIQKNLKRAGIKNPLIHVDDGQKTADFIFREGEYKGIPLPSPLLVLLDLNMPVLDGHQVLKRMKENKSTHRIPVIILTTSGSADEVQLCYDLGCNIFIQKPVEYKEFSEAIKKLGMFLEIMMVPNGE